MNIAQTIKTLEDQHLVLSLNGNKLEVKGPTGWMNEETSRMISSSKNEIVNFLRLADGQPIDAAAGRMLDCQELSPGDGGDCENCGRFNDIETMDGSWHCSYCDPAAVTRHEATSKLIRLAGQIKYNSARIG